MSLEATNIQGVDYIPSHWQIKELKYCLLPGSEGIKIGPFGSALKSEMLVEKGYKVYGQENLIKDDFSLGQRFISEKKYNELSVYEISQNDVLISMMGTVGKCKVVPSNIQKGIMDSHLIRIRFNENLILPEFAAYLIQDAYYIKTQIDLNSKGSIMSGLNSSIIKNFKLILPPVSEQRIILRYLEMKNESLNQLQESKMILLELLEKQRQSIITEAVTKGLNPNVKMKDSGVEWIGEIPEHWKAKKIKYNVELKGVKAEEDTDLQYIGLENIEAKTGKYILSENVEIDGAALKFSKGDVLFGKLRPYLTKVLLADFDGRCSTEILVLKIVENVVLSQYLKYILLSPNFIDEVNSSTYGSKMPRANWSFIGNIFIPLPPLNEQKAIIGEIMEVEKRHFILLSKLKEQIKKLKEYRQSLIYEAVTGKIDVRDMEVD